MERKRLQRAALHWGGLALVAQLWAALQLVHTGEIIWKQTRQELQPFAESMNRLSQLKTAAFKYPAVGVYFVLFVAIVVGTIAVLGALGLREAMAPEPEPADGDSDDDDD